MDVRLIGGGIMSSTLAVWLKELEPQWSMEIDRAPERGRRRTQQRLEKRRRAIAARRF